MNNQSNPLHSDTDEIEEILEKLHWDAGLRGLVNDGQPHTLYNHASGDECIQEATQALSSLIQQKVQEAVEKELNELWHKTQGIYIKPMSDKDVVDQITAHNKAIAERLNQLKEGK